MSRFVLFVAAVFVAAAALARTTPAEAHATLIIAEPAQNAFLQRPPERINLTFSEPLETRSSGIQLLDASGAEIELPAPTFNPATPNVMRVDLPRLEPGIYNVLWFNVSTVDGHPLRGSYPFTVLNPDGSVPDQVNTVGSIGGATDPRPLADAVAVRALSLAGLMAVAGAASLTLLLGAARRRFDRPLLLLAATGLALTAIATALNLATIRDSYSSLGLWSALTDTRIGVAWVVRALAVVAALAGLWLMSRRPIVGAVALLAISAVYGGAYTATSHAAAGDGSNWAQAFDFVHLATAILWVGTVFAVVVLAREAGRAGPYQALLPRFSLLASVLVFVLVLTGFLNSLVEVDAVRRLTGTRYGWTLLAKLGLMIPLLGVAAWNAFRGRHRLARMAPGEPRVFIATAGAEVVLGIAVIALAALLSQTSPTKTVVDQREARTFEQQNPAGDLTVTLQVDPNRTGLNNFTVALTDAAGEPVTADRVRLTFRYQDDQTIGASVFDLARTRQDTFAGQGAYLTLEGQWRVEVSIRRPDVDDAVTFFDVRPAGAQVNLFSRGSAWDNPAPSVSWNELAGIIALAFGLAFVIWRDHLTRLGTTASWSTSLATVAGFGLGTLLLFGVHADPPVSGLRTNPIFPDQDSINRGRAIYEANCISCHGVTGVPPPGLDLNPYPLDLTLHVPQHSDGQIFLFIDQGLPGTAMVGWGAEGHLTEEEIWHVVNYLRTLRLVDQ